MPKRLFTSVICLFFATLAGSVAANHATGNNVADSNTTSHQQVQTGVANEHAYELSLKAVALANYSSAHYAEIPEFTANAQFLSPAISAYSFMNFPSTQELSLAQRSATTGSANEHSMAYLQTSYVIASFRSLDIALSAKIEQLDTTTATYYYPIDPKQLATQYVIRKDITSTTLGIIGNYQLTPNWSIIGALTTTTVGDETRLTTPSADDLAHMALIGATYSF
ncbi:hypothetical protein DXX93_17820 [Thalassotalea euphylliae]|uniref:Uncharacterized protein n=1 Tax=Thalassotalea euphylliae TaxID=1655234 RepID=A0A3E0TV53_9GAMM|nr:MipA/OmpV family protein [Thalassotalea euphylliae]REL28243.1 hypothetical protein DXX93_17820 [Thalassotalea euphylliae]